MKYEVSQELINSLAQTLEIIKCQATTIANLNNQIAQGSAQLLAALKRPEHCKIISQTKNVKNENKEVNKPKQDAVKN